MRPELELLAKIDAYLDNKLSASDRNSFENELNNSIELQEAVEIQKALRKGIEYVSLKQKVVKAYNGYSLFNNLKKWGGATIIVITLLGAYWWSQSNHEKASIEEPPEQITTVAKITESGNVEVGSNLKTEKFIISLEKDTVIETSKGTVIVTFKVKEAITPQEIIKAGLSTFSDEEELETAGMFQFEAYADDQEVQLKKGKELLVEVPTKSKKADMQLFDGVVASTGEVNWVNPKKLENYLTTVDIFSLNLYPPNFEERLIELGFGNKNKRFKDSLFYSFFCGNTDVETDQAPIVFSEDGLFSNDTTPFANTEVIPRSEIINNIKSKLNKYEELKNVKLPYERDFVFSFTISEKNDHPSLSNIKIIQGFEDIQLNNGIVEFYFNLAKFQSNSIGLSQKVRLPFSGDNSNCGGIEPAKIKSIWNRKFQNTLVATKEFESRLQLIYLTCQPEILELYIQNLNLPIYQIDQKAAKLATSYKKEFFQFAAKKEGKVKMDSHLLETLNAYYQTKSKLYHQASENAYHNFWDKQAELDRLGNQKRDEKQVQESQRKWQNYQDELIVNLKSMYKQAGLPDPTIQQINLSNINTRYQFTVQTTGWKNLDRYTVDATQRRKSVKLTNDDGKIAQLSYSELTIELIIETKVDYTLVYLTSNKINSYLRLKKEKGKFNYFINDSLSYNLIALSYINGKPYLYSQKNINNGNHKFDLKAVSESELNKIIDELSPNKSSTSIKEDLEYRKFLVQERTRRKINQDMRKVRTALEPVIFPCKVIEKERVVRLEREEDGRIIEVETF